MGKGHGDGGGCCDDGGGDRSGEQSTRVRRAGRVAALALPLSRDTPASSAAPNAFSSIQSLTLPCTNASSIVGRGGLGIRGGHARSRESHGSWVRRRGAGGGLFFIIVYFSLLSLTLFSVRRLGADGGRRHAARARGLRKMKRRVKRIEELLSATKLESKGAQLGAI